VTAAVIAATDVRAAAAALKAKLVQKAPPVPTPIEGHGCPSQR